jgi:hypothetical protein
MLRENYRRQFVAYSATQLLATGTDYQQVKAEAQKMGEPFLMDWMPALTADVQFYWVKGKDKQAGGVSATTERK